jgi:hypothetical protein
MTFARRRLLRLALGVAFPLVLPMQSIAAGAAEIAAKIKVAQATDMGVADVRAYQKFSRVGPELSAAAEPARPAAVPPKAQPAKVKQEERPDIVFYVAKGDANTCGPGCDEWIAADGKIDAGAPQRLRRLLARLGNHRMPIFFYSPGGSVNGSLELGRLIRGKKLVAGVARTIPGGCDRDNLRDKACEALKRSGMELKSEFDTDLIMCNSGCVLALIGGTARLVPPWGKLGVHSIGDTSKAGTFSPAAIKAGIQLANSRIDGFLRDMGIDVTLRTEAAATPFESVRLLHRDEFSRFGIDTRDFGEADWHYVEKPKPAVLKTFFVRTDKEQIVHRSAALRLSCGSGKAVIFALTRELGPSEPALETQPMTADGATWRFDFAMAARSNVTASGIRFDVGARSLPPTLADLLTADADAGTFEIAPKLADKSARWPQRVTLSMNGFLAAYARLRKACDQPAADRGPQGIHPLTDALDDARGGATARKPLPESGSDISVEARRPQPRLAAPNVAAAARRAGEPSAIFPID